MATVLIKSSKFRKKDIESHTGYEVKTSFLNLDFMLTDRKRYSVKTGLQRVVVFLGEIGIVVRMEMLTKYSRHRNTSFLAMTIIYGYNMWLQG